MYIECLINETNAKDSAGNEADILCDIDRMHKWWPKKYSLVYVLIRLTSLALKQHFFCILYMHTRLVSLISIYTKEYFFGRHLCIRSYDQCGSPVSDKLAAMLNKMARSKLS